VHRAGCPTGQIYDQNKNECLLPKQNLKPMLGWPGGKSRVAKEIVDKIPEHDIYVEPFIGGGSVFFQKNNASKNIINDKNKNLTNFYKHVKKEKIIGCKFPTRKKWDKIKNKRDDGKNLSACEFQQLVKGSYGFMTNTWGYIPKEGTELSINVNKKIDHYQHKLKKTNITTQDYATVTVRHDSKKTFFYVDPPYHKAIDYNQDIIHPDSVAKVYKNVKGNVMISYNDHPDVRKAFPKKDGWKYDSLIIPYTIQGTKNGAFKPKKELLITNY